ncbi:MAG: hypothetical protein IKB34_00845 [Clostridia bacterium]|nr:hypothetical protein [Clostridia bacterium]
MDNAKKEENIKEAREGEVFPCPEENKTVRTIYRTDYKVRRTLRTDIICGALAVITTVLVWLFSSPM